MELRTRLPIASLAGSRLLRASDGAASTTLVAWMAALVIAGAIVIAVFVGDDRGWGAGMTFAVVGIVAVPVAAAFVVWGACEENAARGGSPPPSRQWELG